MLAITAHRRNAENQAEIAERAPILLREEEAHMRRLNELLRQPRQLGQAVNPEEEHVQQELHRNRLAQSNLHEIGRNINAQSMRGPLEHYPRYGRYMSNSAWLEASLSGADRCLATQWRILRTPSVQHNCTGYVPVSGLVLR